MNAPKRRGRPPLPDNEQSIIFKFRIKPEQLEQLRAAAAARGVTMTALILKAIEKELTE